jgi:magnesium transporter
VFESPSTALMERVFELKRSLAEVRRVLAPQREVLGLLARHEIHGINHKTRVYFRDVYDHLVRVYEQIDAARDQLKDTMDAYLSVMANRTNEVTRQLTIFASIFLPLSFIVGFFGQNFGVLTRAEFFWVMVSALAALPVAMVLWFRHKEWL